MNTWQWQLKNTFQTIKQLDTIFTLSADERKAIETLESYSKKLPLQITPHYISLIDPRNQKDPLRLQMIPQGAEFITNSFDRVDPLGEEDHEVVPHLVHRYPDRVLLLITDRCASYCRFCTRKRWVGQGPTPRKEELTQALEYIQKNPDIREVIISGGDSLLLNDRRLEAILIRIRQIKSVDIIRLATRMLTFAPMRVTDNLLTILKKHQPIYILSHINHPNEISKETEDSLIKFADSGLPVLNQTVLLKGVNNKSETLSKLFRQLVHFRARPYYLHQCDIAPGTSHFRVPLKEALELVKSLRGTLSGLCQPTFVIDIPGGHGKVPLSPEYIIEEKKAYITLEGFKGKRARYPTF